MLNLMRCFISMKLHFGCGDDIKEGWINIDIRENKGIDESFDFNIFPYPFNNNTFDYIYSRNVIEYMKDPIRVIRELHRIAKDEAVIEIIVPHYRSSCAHTDTLNNNWFSDFSLKRLFFRPYEKDKFKLISFKKKHSILFKYCPGFILEILEKYLNNVYSLMTIKVKVIKNEF